VFELIGSRYERRSMLITANEPFGEWGRRGSPARHQPRLRFRWYGNSSLFSGQRLVPTGKRFDLDIVDLGAPVSLV
jgi:hypothetical protein